MQMVDIFEVCGTEYDVAYNEKTTCICLNLNRVLKCVDWNYSAMEYETWHRYVYVRKEVVLLVKQIMWLVNAGQ